MLSLFDAHLAALELRDGSANPTPRVVVIILCAIHLAGLAAFWRLEHQSIWLAVPTFALVLAFPLLSKRTLALETLGPLFFLYAIIAARYVAIRVLFAREPYVDEASLADPRLVFFQIEVAALVSVVYVALAQIARYVPSELRPRIWVGLSGLVLIAGIGWFAAETIGHRTRGVTASDPYAYAQMAVDIAARGTPLHSFPLFKEIANEKIAWYPLEHVGYRLFDNLSGEAPTVWPIGGSIWLAAFYRILGEEGLYLATPIAALLSLVAFAFFLFDYFREQSVVTRVAIAAIGVALLATSWEMVDRSIVPLVDAQAQLFTILVVLFTLRAINNTSPLTPLLFQSKREAKSTLPSPSGESENNSKRYVIFGILTGISLALAYHIRHTQVLIAIPILLGAARISGRERYDFLGAAALSALLMAFPDLYYHHLYFGGWLMPESNELSLFSLSYFIPSAFALSERFFAGNEFGYLIPFLIYGSYRAAREETWRFLVLASWVLVLVAFHLPYVAIKMRDLLPEFPPVILLTAYGMFALARDVRAFVITREPRSLKISALMLHGLVPAAILLALLLPAMRTRLTIQRPFQSVKITFGYVTLEQRASFAQIALLTPPNSVIASVMNDGAIDLYAHRDTFRAGVWTSSERDVFLAAMRRAGRKIFLLEDGAEMSLARKDLETRNRFKQIATLDVPLFGETDYANAVLWEME